jgi:hypothetical protein
MENKENKENKDQQQEKYIQSLSEREHKAYLIAKSHLGSSFDLEKSIGYMEWKKNQSSSS